MCGHWPVALGSIGPREMGDQHEAAERKQEGGGERARDKEVRVALPPLESAA